MLQRCFLAFAALLCITASISAQQIKISPANHIANVGKGFCGHCCIETIGRHHGFTEVKGRVARLHEQLGDEGGGMYDEEVCLALQDYQIAYYWQKQGAFRHDWLAFACARGFPCIVHLKPTRQDASGHYVTLVGFYDDYVAVVDSNFPGRLRWLQRELFDDWWTGGFILVYPWYDK